MPFVYYGGKKGSAHRYPPPAFNTIIEPFAGSAGYALAWAKSSTRVILVEKDPAIAEVWRRLQRPDAREMLLAIPIPQFGEPCDPIVGLTTGHASRTTTTTRIERDWVQKRNRIITALPIIAGWEVIEGDYSEAPDVQGCWFVDPPYAPRADGRNPGASYTVGSTEIDYAALGAWCRSRRGQVVVCEQEGADWLPFRPLFVQQSQGGSRVGHSRRVEVIWSRTPGVVQPGTPRYRQAHEARKLRRRVR